MCIPNEVFGLFFPGNVCPDDNQPHFTVTFLQSSLFGKDLTDKETHSEKAYEANVHFNYDEAGNVLSIDVCLIAPMPDCDPNEPIPYEVTEKGEALVKLMDKFFKIAPKAAKS